MQSSPLIYLLASCALATSAAAQQLQWTFTGVTGDEYGTALHQTADQNNDGYVDVIVGAPGWNGDRGYIRCVSGKFLATGSGTVVLWTLYSTANAGARFGSSIIEVGSLTGDIATDYIIGAPGFVSGSVTTGALMLVDGSTHTVVWTMTGPSNTRFGSSLAALGDQSGDGKVEIAANAPGVTTVTPCFVHVISGSSFGVATTLNSSTHSSINSNGSAHFGATVASGFDLDHDGLFDLAVGSPDLLSSGVVTVFRANGSFTVLGSFSGQTAGERMGASIDGTRDFNGDGVVDFVAGAPGFPDSLGGERGRAVLISGAQLLAATFPFEIFTFNFGGLLGFDSHFGAAVRASADLNGDGVGEILVGAPGYMAFGGGGSFTSPGHVSVFSGATGARIASIVGGSADHLGDALLGGFLDMNSDGFPEFAAAGALSDTSNADAGTVKYYRLFPAPPTTYCTAKVNSLGCLPAMSWSGTASASSSSPFLVTCSNVISQKSGLLMYSHLPNATAFQGGTLCVKAPLKRTPPLSSGGSASGSDCSGAFSFDMNARIQSGVDATLVAGSETFAQYWSRDTASPSQTNLSNALRFLINP